MRLLLATSTVLFCVMALLGTAGSAIASEGRKVPAFEFRGLDEREHRLTDAEFSGKPLLITAFTTWNEASRAHAREVEAFHKANPGVVIIALIVDAPAEARDFVRQEALTFPCYKADPVSRVGSTFNRLFETKKDKTLTLNRIPFTILADAERTVRYANLGPADGRTLGAQAAKLK